MAKAKVTKKLGKVGMELPECPVCMETMSAPIFQCQSGHSLCNTCTKNLSPSICPICRQSMTQIRNWQLEEVISRAIVSCPNKPAGCIYTMINTDLDDHVQECIFREMACPLGVVFGKCFWSGRMNGILYHFKECHPENCISNADADVNINNVSISADNRHMYIITQNKLLFLISFKIDTFQKMAYWVVQHFGSKKRAQQHIYEINITSNQDNLRKVFYNDHCFSDATDANEIFSSSKCAVMPLTMLSTFIKNEQLTFSFNVKRYQPGVKKDTNPNNINRRGNTCGPTNSGFRGRSKSYTRTRSPGLHIHKGHNNN